MHPPRSVESEAHHHLCKTTATESLAGRLHPDLYRSARDLFWQRRDPISVGKVLANKADTFMDRVSPSTSNLVGIGGSRGTVLVSQ